jgi:hypothetical protein
VPLDVLDVVQSRSERVVDVNDEYLPVGLTLIEQGHDTENLDLLDLTGVADGLTDLADIERVVVTKSLGLGVLDGRVFPGLWLRATARQKQVSTKSRREFHWKRTCGKAP